MSWDEAFAIAGRSVLSRAELLGLGATGRSLTLAVRGGGLQRLRRDHYALPTLESQVGEAVRVGGRISCVTALRSYGVFAFDNSALHVHVDREASRLRSPKSRRAPLTKVNRGSTVLHWSPLVDPHGGDEHRIGLRDALAHTVMCQDPRHAIASLDNALHLGLIDDDDVSAIFAHLPNKYGWMRAKLNPLAEAGQETELRLLVEAAGYRYQIQQNLPGLGRVDLVVEDVLVVEADSRAHHDGWEHHVRDRRRDLIAAQLGYASLRPAYQHTMYEPDLVTQSIVALVTALTR
ncbi:DUF559 domain-containing protein [Humibacter soli]